MLSHTHKIEPWYLLGVLFKIFDEHGPQSFLYARFLPGIH